MTLIRVVDLESTGIPSEADPHAVCEVGWASIVDGVLKSGKAVRCNPGRPMPVEAMAVHHLTDADLAGAPPFAEVLPGVLAGVDYLVAHNAAFERKFIGGPLPWICTWKVAVRLWPDAPAHSNQVLRYWLGVNADPKHAMPPHRALPDAYTTALIFLRAMTLASLDDMVAWSAQPVLLRRSTSASTSVPSGATCRGIICSGSSIRTWIPTCCLRLGSI